MKRMNVKTYIADLYIPIGSYITVRRALMRAGIATVEDLCRKSEEELSRIPYVKGKNLQAVKYLLEENGLRTGMSREELDEYNTIYWSNL